MTDLATKRDVILERALGLVEDWADWQGHPAQGPRTARDLLAVWGALARLSRPDQFPAEASPLSELLQREASAILATAARAPGVSPWLERAHELDRAWDFATDREAVRDLEFAAVTLFDELDRISLAACMAPRLDSEGARAEPWETWRRQVAAAEDWFAGHVDAFLPVAPLAGATLAACRPGLEEDEALWDTVLKHRLLEETAEELEAVPSLQRLSESDKQAVQTKVDHGRPNGIPRIVPTRRQGRQLQAYSRDVLPQARIAAAPAVAEIPETQALRLVSPGRRFEARILLPAVVDASEELVRVNCYDVAGGDPALPLAGETACLAGVERQLDERARADFTLQQLRDTGEDLFLEIAGELWTPEPNP